jgi:CheY-like chemotaxis protein
LAAEGAAALGLVSSFNPDLILLDLRMPVMDGKAFLVAYQKLNLPPCPIIIFSAALLGEPPMEATVYLPKPFDLNDLFTHIATLLNRTPPS